MRNRRTRPVSPDEAARFLKAQQERAKRAVQAAVETGDLPAMTAKDMSEAEVQEALRPTDLDVIMLNRIATGKAGRHSQAILSAIKLKLEWSTRKPEAVSAAQAPVTVVINNLGDAESPTPVTAEAGDNKDIQ